MRIISNIDTDRSAFVIVLCFDHWYHMLVNSLREYFDEDIIFINNLPYLIDDTILYNNCTIINNISNDKSYGAGLDLALQFMVAKGLRYMISIESDSIVYNKQFKDQLFNELTDGINLVGTECLFEKGPVIRSPILLDITQINKSFTKCRRDKVDTNIFSYKQLVLWLHRNKHLSDEYIQFILSNWDDIQHNWYLSASSKKFACCGPINGLHHLMDGDKYQPVFHPSYAKFKNLIDRYNIPTNVHI